MQNGNISLPTDLYPWSADTMLEVILPDPDSFLKIRETLSRIGVASKQDKTLWQSAHILHKRGRYYVCMFKEMFLLDGKDADLTYLDIWRRNTIASLLQQWGLCMVIDPGQIVDKAPMSSVKVVPYKEKHTWNLCSKYTMGPRR